MLQQPGVFAGYVSSSHCDSKTISSGNTMLSYTLPMTSDDIARRIGKGGISYELRGGTSRFLAQKSFIFYKAVVAMYFLFWCVWWPLVDKKRVTIYLTFWIFYTATLYFIVSTLNAILCYLAIERERPEPVKPGEDPPPIEVSSRITPSPVPVFLRLTQHLTWNISLVGSMVIVTIYFAALYDGGTLGSVDINAHIVFPSVMLFDMYFVASEYQCRGYWYSEYFGIVYLLFNLIWYYEGIPAERRVYPILDWEKNTDTAALYVFLILFVMIPTFATGFLLVYRLREWMYLTCFDRTDKSSKKRSKNKETRKKSADSEPNAKVEG